MYPMFAQLLYACVVVSSPEASRRTVGGDSRNSSSIKITCGKCLVEHLNH